MITNHNMQAAALDVGGTKIEARIVDAAYHTLLTQRWSTPKEEALFVTALSTAIEWIVQLSGRRDIPIGIGLPGIVDVDNATYFGSNLPALTGSLFQAVEDQWGRGFVWENDCRALGLSEFMGGVADGCAKAIGLIIGTGIAAGYVENGVVSRNLQSLALEMGHIGISARMQTELALPLFRCGCGKMACIESYASGTGFAALMQWKTGRILNPADFPKEDCYEEVFDIWLTVLAEAIENLILVHDPEVIAIGGGMSHLPNLVNRLEAKLAQLVWPNIRIPAIRLAKFGDSSGARGMAILADQRSRKCSV